MVELQIVCFGEFHVTLGGRELRGFPTEKVRALLAYLAIEGRAHQRSELAQLLWPGYSPESARHSLRQALFQLRNLLGDVDADSPWLLLARQSVQLNPAAPVRVDVITFTQLLAAAKAHAHADLAACAACLEGLREAAALYGGDFLAGFAVADSDPFEEWRRILQEQLHIELLDVLTQLANAAERTVFEMLEQYRCESLAGDEHPGVRRNLQHRFEAWSRAFVRSRLTETRNGLLLYALASYMLVKGLG